MEPGRTRRLDPLQLITDIAKIRRINRVYQSRTNISKAQWFAGIVSDAKRAQVEGHNAARSCGRKVYCGEAALGIGLLVLSAACPPVALIAATAGVGLAVGATAGGVATEVDGGFLKLFDADGTLTTCKSSIVCPAFQTRYPSSPYAHETDRPAG
jgi:hypothetical protein